MPILQVVLILIVVGVALYLVNTYVTMDAKIKGILNVVVVIVVVLWLLNLFVGPIHWGTLNTPRR